MKRFYIYIHIDPRNNQPKYVGKGTKNRAYELHRGRNREYLEWKKTLDNLGFCIKVEILEYFEDEILAYKKECEIIKFYREKGIILFNVLSGGDGSLCGPNNPMFGKKRPDLSIRNSTQKGKTIKEIYGEKKALNISKKLSKAKELNPMFGKTRPDLSKRNSLQKGKNIEELYGEEKANIIRVKKGGVSVIRNDGKIFYSLKNAAKLTGTSKYLIKQHLLGFFDNINGYTFQYLSENTDIKRQS